MARFAADLGRHAAGRGDTINEAYLQGIVEGLALAELLISDDARLMTRWVQILAAQQLQSTCPATSVLSASRADHRALSNSH